jgi:sulfatase maturation enzyme AslB (radical SAM superfamily)
MDASPKASDGSPEKFPVTAVNLSLSSACGADCIYCPSDRGQRIKTKIMPMETAEKIIREVTSDEFTRNFNFKHLQVGENGDCFINKHALDIMRLIRSIRPTIPIGCTTNFQNFTDDKVEAVIKEGLIDLLTVNIDGHTDESFRAVKRISLRHALHGLHTFFNLRNQYMRRIRVAIVSITYSHYVNAVRQKFNRLPVKLANKIASDIVDDYDSIYNQISPALWNSDSIVRGTPFFWAERELVDTAELNYAQYTCPNLGRIANEAWIAPDGNWYACCYDSNNHIILGNVLETSVAQVAVSPERARVIEHLRARRFQDVGGPCLTVNCC